MEHLSPVILTKLPQETRIIISREVASDQCPILEALLAEIQAREKAGVTLHIIVTIILIDTEKSSLQMLHSLPRPMLFLVVIAKGIMIPTLVQLLSKT